MQDLEGILEFFNRLMTAEAETWALRLNEGISWIDTIKQRKVLNAFFEAKPGDVIEQLDRPRNADAEWLEKNGAKTVGARTVHAIQATTVDGVSMAQVYADDYRKQGFGAALLHRSPPSQTHPSASSLHARIATELGVPSAVIRLRMLTPTIASVCFPSGDFDRRRSPRMRLKRSIAFSARAC